MILKLKKIPDFINLSHEEINVFYIPQTEELFNFVNTLFKEIEDETEEITIFDGDKKIKLDANVDYITDVFTITLNKKKLITYLYKKIILGVSNTEKIFTFNTVKECAINWLNDVKKATLIDFDFTQDVEEQEVFILMKVQFKEEGKGIFERLVSYLETIAELGKTKIVFINFLFQYFSEKEIYDIKNICLENNIVLVCVEKNKPSFMYSDLRLIKFFDNNVMSDE